MVKAAITHALDSTDGRKTCRTSAISDPSEMPTMPPMAHSTIASSVNCRRMVRFVAPMALRMPISRVRSVTDTSMMFITPTPPTINPTLDSANINRNSPPVSCDQSLVSESEPNMAKLSSLSTGTLRRTRNTSRTSSSTAGRFVGSSYFAVIQ